MAKKFIRTCSIWRTLEVVGDTSTLLILEASWLGARRFEDFRNRTGLLKPLLSDRLKRLLAAEIFERRLYSEAPRRFEYQMTQKGRDLYWTALMMLRWERHWAPPEGKIEIILRHKGCGEVFDPTPVCGECRQEVTANDVDWTEGPGVGLMAATYSRRRRYRDMAANRPAESTLLDHVAQITGDRWASLVLRSIFTGLRKFDEICDDTAIATNILSERLSWLCTIGVLTMHQYSDRPARFEYRLTPKGIDYYPILLMLLKWGDKYYVAPEGPPLLLKHRPCGADLEAMVVCSACGEAVGPETVEYEVVETRPIRSPEQSAAS
ncbi:winged helix-turn-helix transcriptional regulator [Maricaulis sp.]|uniref:winged helix-turn-helix transcriptional regulator n=1 Tax=Maricaulis sp. TaxID=1486257 RepID=UPI003A92527C